MSEIDQETPDPIYFAGGVLDETRHVCAFVNSRDQEHLALDPFVSEGVERGDKLVYFVDSGERANLVHHLRHLGLDMPQLIEHGRCEIRTWAETYLCGGHFDPDAMLGVLEDLLGSREKPRIRLIADMGWAAQEPAFNDRLIEFEARANFVHADNVHAVICVYDLATFGADVVIDVLRTHPMALIGGVLQVNPFYVPPAEFLAELRSRNRLLDA